MALCPECLTEKPFFAGRCPNCIQEVPLLRQLWAMVVYYTFFIGTFCLGAYFLVKLIF